MSKNGGHYLGYWRIAKGISMKKIKTIVLVCVTICLALTVYADEFNPLVFQYSNPEVTVVFSEALNVSAERHQEIAYEIAGVPKSTIVDTNVMTPDNIICTLFGHDLSTTTVTATHHKVRVYSPRCLVELYHVTACSRCSYTDPVLVNSFHMVCCPED